MVGPAPRPRRWCAARPGCSSPAPRCACPLVAVMLRRGYGLGAQAMVGGSLHEPLLTVAWPGAHLGPMGLEGAVRLGLRKELEAIADDEASVRSASAQATAAPGTGQGAQRRAAVRDRRCDRPRRDRGLIAATLAAAASPEQPPRGQRFVDTW